VPCPATDQEGAAGPPEPGDGLLSGGRLILGLGSGYLVSEFEALGLRAEEGEARMDEGLAALLGGARSFAALGGG
jgi:hypothetical protein